MKKIFGLIVLIIFLFSLFEAFSLPAPGSVRYIYGWGGTIEYPDGTICYCPLPSSDLCAVIRKEVTGIPEYPDELTHYENGQPVETVNVREAGVNENGQPTWYVQPQGGKFKGFGIKNRNNNNKLHH